MIFTPGNILTLCISIVLIIIFRQMDRNNRSIEKAKKFGDKLKDDLDSYIKARTSSLDEASVALDVQQAKAVAAVKRLEEIRADIQAKEASLLERNKAVESFGKQIEAYDATIRQLMEMSAHAEDNLTRITSESDFADSLGKKLLASQRQLQEISERIPALTADFTRQNQASLQAIHQETLEKMGSTIADLERKIANAHQSGSQIVSQASEKLKELYQKAYTEAAKRADSLEDTAFQKLKEQANERLHHYKDTVEEKTKEFQEQAKHRLIEVQQLLKTFKSEWQSEAASLAQGAQEERERLEAETAELVSRVEHTTRSSVERLEAESAQLIARLTQSLSQAETKTASRLESLSESLEHASVDLGSALDELRQDVDFRMGKFEQLAHDTERLDEQLRIVMNDTEKRVTGDFALYQSDQEAKRAAFAEKLLADAQLLQGRMDSLESGLNELKSKAYENVSEKLKGFEDDFLADLARRSDAITSSLDQWRQSVDERLEALSSDSEADRRELETKYTASLTERLTGISEQYRMQSARLEEQIQAVENELRSRITASGKSILDFVEDSRREFAEARESANAHVQGELSAYNLSLQEVLRRQERDIEAKTRQYLESVESAKTESDTVITTIRADFSSWQARNEQQLADAKSLLDDRLASFEESARSAMADLQSAHQSEFRDFVADTAEERKQLKDSIDNMKGDITLARESFERKIADALSDFGEQYEQMTSGTALRMREHAAETDQTIKGIKAMVQDLRDSVDQTREKLFQKVQSDTQVLSQNLEEIDRRQKAFVAQTRIFDRADELKTNLEANIATLKDEISRLDVYREAMSALEGQYGKVRKLEEEANQKMSRFMAEKKRIDILETDFSKLLALSDSIDRKISELTITNDDLQQYQVQIRRFEESIAEVNNRYERLEKKSLVLDQTVDGVDRAFENLKALETSLASWRADMEGIPADLESIKDRLSTLLDNKEKTDAIIEHLDSLDSVLTDVEQRTEKMQGAREWLARTETRLEEISRQSQDQLKLLGDLLKEDGGAKKTKGAPPIGIRENVVKLAHQGWKVDEISRALHLSRGEVELILELPQK